MKALKYAEKCENMYTYAIKYKKKYNKYIFCITIDICFCNII